VTSEGREGLARRLAALSEAAQRVVVLAEEAARLEAGDLSDLLAALVSRGMEGRREHDHIALVTVMDYLESALLDDERRADLLRACRERNHRHLQRLLLSPSGPAQPDEARVPDYGKGRPLTLGERKSLARRPNRKVLERVLADPHPAVIHNLLMNPKLTELDVLKLVSRRPLPADVLRELYRNPRWSRRYRVKVGLVRNPSTPPSIATKLLPQLMRQDLEEVLEDRGLHPSVLISCRRLLEGEGPAGADEDAGEETDAEDPGDGGPTLH
jgi:hypothetical protein